MATDKLIFPIGFDLEKAVADAEGQADKLLRRLETTIRSRPLAINLKINNAGNGSINEINARMRDIVKEWNNLTEAERIASKTSGEYTDRAKKLIAEFVRLTGATESYARSLQQITAAARKASAEQEKNLEKQRKTEKILKSQENTIFNITAKLQHWKKEMNSADMGSKQFRSAAEEVRRLSHNLSEAQRKVNSLTDNFRKQDGYISRLVKRLAVYAGYQQITNFVTAVREVTAEFELQRISLGAIIQDQAKANQLFSEIKQFALKSPVKILDLTKYTKQLAAYKFETAELFDWTKRLTDISVGLGVSMDRIILLAGQIRATGYLRGSEVRQATEAGIPLVEELAKKLEELNGRAYTTAEVMNLISERAISWEMVADVFKDMTSAGGMFFDIQEKQGNTLYGMWQKLGDAASVMYEEIGNTKSVNEGMMNLISIIRTLMLNWKQTGATLGTIGVAVLLYTNRLKLAEMGVKLSIIAESKSVLALKSKQAALARLIAIQRASTGTVKADTVATKLWTAVKLRGVQALNLMKAALKGLQATLVKNIWGIAILGLSLLIEKLWLAEDATKKLQNKLANIKLDYEVKQGQDASNFEYLAKAAVDAANGSKAQKDALEELRNTYGKIIPMELLTIENLERMKGNYGELITLIDEYNLKQKYEAERNAIEESFAPEQEKRAGIIREKLREGLRLDYADEETGDVFDKVLDLSERNIQRFLLNLNKYADEGLDKKEQIIKASADMAKEIGLNEEETKALTNAMLDLDRGELEGQGTLMDYTEGLQRKHEALSVVNDDYDKAKQKLNEFSSIVDDVMKKNEDEPEVTEYNNLLENEKARLNNQIGDIANGIIELFNTANAEVDSVTKQLLQTVIDNGGMIPDTVWDILEETAKSINNPKLLAAIQSLRKHYKKLAPDNETVNFVKNGFIKIVEAARGNLQEYRQYLYDGSVTIKEYQDNLQTSIAQLKAQAYEMIKVNALIDAGLADGQKYDEATIKALQDKADNLQAILDKYVTPLVIPDDKKNKGKSGSKSDPRLQTLQEIANKMAEVNKEYDDLLKKEGQTKALADTQKLFAESFKQMQSVANKYKFKLPEFEVPQTVEDVQKWYDAIIDNIKRLKLKNADKVLIELGFKRDKAAIDKQQKDIEAELKNLSDRISRTKTAKEFYDKILSQTGDIELAGNLTMSIYGSEAGNIQELLAQQIQGYFGEYEVEVPVIAGTDKINYKRLRELAKAAYDAKKIGKDAYDALAKITTDGEKDLAKIAEQGAKLLLKYDEIAQQRVNIEQESSEKIRQLREAEALFLASDASEQEKAVYKKRTNKAVAGVEADRDLGLLKLKDEYMRFFSAIHSLTNKEAETLRTQVRQALFKAFQSGAISADKLKKELRTVDEQFRKLKDDSGMAMDYLKGGFDGLIQRVRDTADELQSVAAEISKMESPDQISEGQKGFIDKVLGKFGNENTGKSFMDLFSKAKGDTGQMATNLQGCAEGMEGMADNASQALAIVDLIITSVDATIRGIAQIRDQLNEMRSEDNKLKGGFWDAFEYFENFNKYAASGWEKLKNGNVIGAATDTISSIISLFGTARSQKVRKLNEEIKRQGDIIEDLQYTYSRLQKTADKLFDKDYINNYNQQLKTLQAQAAAYQKQAQAEKDKGKATDKDKLKEYENSYRDTLDEMADMQSQFIEKFTGSSRADVSRQMAQSWLDAKASMSDTFAAIQGDYKDMIKNMIVEGAAARVIENALTPMWEKMDKMLADNNVEGAIDALVGGMDDALNTANNGMEVLWKALEARGYDMKQLIGDVDENYTGIKRDIAGASEETMSNVATIGNTLMYYVSPIPGIAANVAMMRQIMESGNTSSMPTANAGVDFAAYHTQSLEHLNTLTVRTSEILAQCRELNSQTKSIADALDRVVVYKGNSHGIKVYM